MAKYGPLSGVRGQFVNGRDWRLVAGMISAVPCDPEQMFDYDTARLAAAAKSSRSAYKSPSYRVRHGDVFAPAGCRRASDPVAGGRGSAYGRALGRAPPEPGGVAGVPSRPCRHPSPEMMRVGLDRPDAATIRARAETAPWHGAGPMRHQRPSGGLSRATRRRRPGPVASGCVTARPSRFAPSPP